MRRALLLTDPSSLTPQEGLQEAQGAFVRLQLAGYQAGLKKALQQVQDDSRDRVAELAQRKVTPEQVQAKMRALGWADAPIPVPGSAYKVSSALFSWYSSLPPQATYGISLRELNRDLDSLDAREAMSDQEVERTRASLMADAKKGWAKLANFIKDAVTRAGPAWSGSFVEIAPDSDYLDQSGVLSAQVYVYARTRTRTSPGFSLVLSEEGKAHVDDVLDAGDRDFFDEKTPGVEGDYFTLISEIRKPGSTSRTGKTVLVYTARPVRDRALYARSQQTKSIPSNLFVTSDFDNAEGISRESLFAGKDQARDIYAIRLDSRYLQVTLDRGHLKEYQTYDKSGHVPIKSLELVQMGA